MSTKNNKETNNSNQNNKKRNKKKGNNFRNESYRPFRGSHDRGYYEGWNNRDRMRQSNVTNNNNGNNRHLRFIKFPDNSGYNNEENNLGGGITGGEYSQTSINNNQMQFNNYQQQDNVPLNARNDCNTSNVYNQNVLGSSTDHTSMSNVFVKENEANAPIPESSLQNVEFKDRKTIILEKQSEGEGNKTVAVKPVIKIKEEKRTVKEDRGMIVNIKKEIDKTTNPKVIKKEIDKTTKQAASSSSSDSSSSCDSSDSEDKVMNSIKTLAKGASSSNTVAEVKTITPARIKIEPTKSIVKKAPSSSSDSSTTDSDSTEDEQNKSEERKPSEEEVVYIGKLNEHIENLVDEDDSVDEVGENGEKKICLLCEKEGHTSFYCQMICKNCNGNYHGLKNCPKPPNSSIVMQYFLQFCMEQCCHFNPNNKFKMSNIQTDVEDESSISNQKKEEDIKIQKSPTNRSEKKKLSKRRKSISDRKDTPKSSITIKKPKYDSDCSDSSGENSDNNSKKSSKRRLNMRQNFDMSGAPITPFSNPFPMYGSGFNPQMQYPYTASNYNQMLAFNPMMGFNPAMVFRPDGSNPT